MGPSIPDYYLARRLTESSMLSVPQGVCLHSNKEKGAERRRKSQNPSEAQNGALRAGKQWGVVPQNHTEGTTGRWETSQGLGINASPGGKIRAYSGFESWRG